MRSHTKRTSGSVAYGMTLIINAQSQQNITVAPIEQLEPFKACPIVLIILEPADNLILIFSLVNLFLIFLNCYFIFVFCPFL